MTLAIIQARLGSTRLPRKALAFIGDKPLIRHVVDRVRAVGVRVVVAVPSDELNHWLYVPDDSGTELFAAAGCDTNDVLGRFAACAKRYGADTIMRVTGDCPLWNPRIAEQVLALYRSDPGIEYASNIAPGYVDGEDVEVFSAGALAWAHREATDPHDREHVTPWIRRHVKCATLQPETFTPKPKTSVDTVEDLERVRAILREAACSA